jgi:hypothetical protein
MWMNQKRKTVKRERARVKKSTLMSMINLMKRRVPNSQNQQSRVGHHGHNLPVPAILSLHLHLHKRQVDLFRKEVSGHCNLLTPHQRPCSEERGDNP